MMSGRERSNEIGTFHSDGNINDAPDEQRDSRNIFDFAQGQETNRPRPMLAASNNTWPSSANRRSDSNSQPEDVRLRIPSSTSQDERRRSHQSSLGNASFLHEIVLRTTFCKDGDLSGPVKN